MKTVAVMQPYFFPYLGYFQLVAASSAFVFLQDVTFIKGGWINRNRFLVNDRDHLFTVPLRAASSHQLIATTAIADTPDWRPRFLRLLNQSYARAPFREGTMALVSRVIDRSYASIGELAEESVRAVCAHVGLPANWQDSRQIPSAEDARGAVRIKGICTALGANRYVNAPGGKELYDIDDFARSGIELRFLNPSLPNYQQAGGAFVSGLSIIDVLMFNSPEQTCQWMETHALE